MRPLRLTLSNFQSFRGEHEIPLGLIRCAVVIGLNGAGKSSIFDGIRFCLWGFSRVPRDLNWVITHGEQVCRVEFEFALSNEHYLVSRQRSSKGAGSTTLAFHRLTADGPQELDGKTATETQQRIIETLHMTDELFRISACGSQRDEMQLTDEKPGKRRELLGGIVIPDPLIWDMRADMARQMLRDCEAKRTAQASALTHAEQNAALAPEIETQIVAVADEMRLAEVGAKTIEAQQTLREWARQDLVEARAADQARRKELTDLEARAVKLTDARAEAENHLHGVEEQVAGKPGLLARLRAAEGAQEQAAEMEAVRQERERLANDARPIAEQIKAAKAEHGANLQRIELEIKRLHEAHASQVYALEIEIGAKRAQTDVLSTVPCTPPESGGAKFASACPLLGQALEARDALPALETKIGALRGQTPWADDEKRLAELQAQTPAAGLIATRDALKAQYDAISYDAVAHAAAKTAMAAAQDLQRKAATIEAVEGQLPALREALRRAEAEAAEISERMTALRQALGAERDWTAELAAVDKRISEMKAAQTNLREQIAQGQRRHGVLTEQLRQAQEAAGQVETLRGEIAEIDRRAALLKILGNQYDGAFSKAGIPALLVEQAIPELEEAANEILQMLSDGQLSVELKSQRENKDGSIAEALDIIVYGPQGERPFESFSGGEAIRVALSMRGGISMLRARLTGARCELLILDEPRWLDGPGQDVLVDCLARLSDRFACILLATHIERLKDMFPCRLEVSKDADGSRVEVIS